MASDGPAARLIDLTRLVSRAGRVPTGVDRVELAHAGAVADADVPAFALVRTALGYLLLDRAGITAVAHAVRDGDWGSRDIASRLSLRLDRDRQRGQSHARRLAVARCTGPSLGRMLARHLPPGTAYLNVGHSNLSARAFDAVRRIPQAQVTVFIHDTIPLDLPQMQRPGTAVAFAAKLALTARHADLILCPSRVSRADILRHAPDARRIVAVPLGVTPARPDPAALPPGLNLTAPYFVALGTIEPRKNIALLLDIWDAMGTAAPRLYLCGSRGWRNEELFARLDRGVPGVTELRGLSDGAVAALLAGARALLFPSVAEGYGLPLAEAAALGVPVLCGDLAICREVLGAHGVYLATDAVYLWRERISAFAALDRPPAPPVAFAVPTWADHFKIVLTMT